MGISETSIDELGASEETLKGEIASMFNEYSTISAQTLMSIVALICGITIDDIKNGKKRKHSHARWVLFRAYQYMENASFDNIVSTFNKLGITTEYYGVRLGIMKISELTKTEKYWRDRCIFVESIISKNKISKQEIVIKDDEKDIIVIVPKELKNRIKIKQL